MAIAYLAEYKLGFREIDQQHQEFVLTMNQLYDAFYTNSVKEEIEKVFASLDDYAEHHFATEEKYFDLFKYENAEEHKKEHREFKKRLIDLKDNFTRNPDVLKIMDFFEDWLTNHLNGHDKKYVQCFRDHGLK